MSEDDIRHPELWQRTSWNITLQEESRRVVACMVNYIVPGHGPIFRVTDSIRQYFRCS